MHQRSREWEASHVSKNVESFVVKNEGGIKKVQRLAMTVETLTAAALLFIKFRKGKR